MKLIIEKGIPLPMGRETAKDYPLSDMEVGDSFLIPDTDKRRRGAISCLIHRYGKLQNKEFVTRKAGSGTRVWRLK
jgi:hypothetical protein